MDFGFDSDQELLVDNLRDLILRDYPESYFKECDRAGTYPVEYKKALVDHGFSLLGIPEEYGGVPCNIATLMLVAETCARCGAPYYLWGESIQIDDILTFGNDQQKKIVMDVAKTGHQPFALGFTEPGAGSDNAGMTCSVTHRDGKMFISGEKTLISNVDDAPYILTLTRDTEDPNPHKAITMWLIPLDRPGISVNHFDKIGWHMTTTSEVFFNEVEVFEEDMVGVEGRGFIQLMKNFEIERILVCACLLGAAECCFDDAVEFAKAREQFGKPIGSFQLIQQKITDMAIEIENMRNMLYKCAWMKDTGQDIQIMSALCKRYVGESSWRVIDEALQIHGGVGYISDTRVSRIWRDARVGRIGAGTSEIMVHIAGRAIQKTHKTFGS